MKQRCNATIYTTGRHGCWWTCACGSRCGDEVWRTGIGATFGWALHVADVGGATPCPTS